MPIGLGTALIASTGMQIGASGLGALYGSKQAKRSAKRQYRYQMAALLNGPSYQVAGLRRAGLNPILAATGGFGGNLSSMSAPMPSTPSVDMPDVASSAKDVSQAGVGEAEVIKKAQETTKIIADTKLVWNQQKQVLQQILESRQRQKVFKASEKKLLEEVELVSAKIVLTAQEVMKIDAQTSLMAQQAQTQQADMIYKDQLTLESKSKRRLLEREIKALAADYERLKDISSVYEGPIGKILTYIEALARSLGLTTVLSRRIK